MLLRFPHMALEPIGLHWKLAFGTASFPPTFLDVAVLQFAVFQKVGDDLVVGHRPRVCATVPLAVIPFVIVAHDF